MNIDFEQQLLEHRAGLLRWCTYLTHDPSAVDDLVQETWIEAWRNRHKLVDPAGMGAWLRKIARYVCLRWQRASYQQMTYPLDEAWCIEDFAGELAPSDFAARVEQAMGVLPLPTRQLLIARYLDEKSPAEIASEWGISENVLHVRLHRGKTALAGVLRTQQWQPTRLWCYGCGQQYFRTQFAPAEGKLILDCERCGFTLENASRAQAIFGTVKGVKSALNRLMNWSSDYFAPAAERMCQDCQQPVQIKAVSRQTARGAEIMLEADCSRCGRSPNVSLYGQAIHSPVGQRFWRDHARVRILPHQTIDRDGQAAVITVLQSITSTDSLHVISTIGEGRILYVGKS